jgi:hypothetical protein
VFFRRYFDLFCVFLDFQIFSAIFSHLAERFGLAAVLFSAKLRGKCFDGPKLSVLLSKTLFGASCGVFAFFYGKTKKE